MKKIIQIHIFALLTVSHMVIHAQDEEPCKMILQNGLYKTYQMARTENFQYDLKSYLSSEQFKEHFKDNRWGGSLSIIADNVPIKLGVNSSAVEMNEFQQKIRMASELTMNQSFYDYANTNIPDVELAKAYTECIGIRKFGFKIISTVSEKEVLFIVSYQNEINSDPMPKVVRFEITGASNIVKSFNIGDNIKNQTSITCSRDPDKDLILVLETDRGVASSKVAADPVGFNKDLPVGTIISSYLNFTELQIVTKNNSNNPSGPTWSPKFSKWAPADGREVPSSSFQRITNETKVPDLRGVFLRGLNIFDQNQKSLVAVEKADPEHRTIGSFQSDGIKEHSHQVGSTSNDISNGNDKDYSSGAKPNTYGYKTWKCNDCGPETRPKNVSIYYYIRIN